MGEAIGRDQVENFLYREALLLDRWQLDEWLDLFTTDARYLVPSTDQPDGDPEGSLFLVADERSEIEARVTRLKHSLAHAEQPHSLTRRMVGNVIIECVPTPATLEVIASFIIFRTRRGITDQYFGHYHHRLAVQRGALKFLERKAILDMRGLRPMGSLSIIV
jgi:p-cumate 2,3-dioxygenase subunit beta